MKSMPPWLDEFVLAVFLGSGLLVAATVPAVGDLPQLVVCQPLRGPLQRRT